MDETAAREAILAILGDLIAIPSPFPPGECTAIGSYAAARLRKAGYGVDVVSRKAGVDNVVAKLGGGPRTVSDPHVGDPHVGDPHVGDPHIVFNAHVDTVGVGERANWLSDPFKATVKDGRVFGLGAGNCKGSMAVQLWLAEEIARRGGPRRGEVAFTFVGDEENLGPDGMAFLREAGHVRPDVLILGAQTENQMIVSERGVFWARVTTRGRAAHAGNPAAGDNAILRMVRLVGALEKRLAPKLARRADGAMRSTINVGMFHGGHNTNVVPAACTVEIDRRILPSERVKTAYAELKAALAAAREKPGSWSVEFLTGTNGFKGAAGGPGIAALAAAIKARTGRRARFLNATGVSDGRYFADDGIEIVNFGPGSGAQGHAANESVPIAQLVDAAAIQLDAVERLAGLRR